jgi:hypothetical protein
VGGYDNNTKQFLTSCERFSLKSEQWSAFPKLKVARRSPGVVSYKGQVGHAVETEVIYFLKENKYSHMNMYMYVQI